MNFFRRTLKYVRETFGSSPLMMIWFPVVSTSVLVLSFRYVTSSFITSLPSSFSSDMLIFVSVIFVNGVDFLFLSFHNISSLQGFLRLCHYLVHTFLKRRSAFFDSEHHFYRCFFYRSWHMSPRSPSHDAGA